MLSDDIKSAIQQAYSRFLTSRGLKARYGQKLMIAEIARTLGNIELDENHQRTSDGHICVVEAGTGTGKTVAYLLAAIPIASLLGKKLVVSTATVALQEQIMYKDLPELKEHSELEFSFTLAKGRGRYVCLSKLDKVLYEQENIASSAQALYEDEQPAVDPQALKIYQDMLNAMAAGDWDGDKDDWADELDDRVWFRVTTDHRQCTGRRCSHVNSCSFFKARESLDNVDVIVSNHDLVLSDLALGGGAILPDPADALFIFDEGHHLPDKALNHFAHQLRVIGTTRWLEQCHKSVTPLLNELGEDTTLAPMIEALPKRLDSAKTLMQSLWPLLQTLAGDLVDSTERSPRYRFDNGVVDDNLREMAEQLKFEFVGLSDHLERMVEVVQDLLDQRYGNLPKADLENWFPVLGMWASRAQAGWQLWASYAVLDAPGTMPKARWLTLFDNGVYVDIEICSSPILASGNLQTTLWNSCFGAVVTSATLAALGNFERFKMRAGTPDNATYTAVPSPFDFNNAVFKVPKKAVDAGNAQAHTQSLIELLPAIINEPHGKLLLFSSRRQMNEVLEALPGSIAADLLVQGERSKKETIAQHKRRIDDGKPSTLVGLASFAEGLDLPGDYCRHVVIAKIPFAVPDDPIEAALAEWIDAKGGNAFMEISVPDAAIKLVQACGRLLRNERDSGAITLMDNRILRRRYGDALFNSLPPYKREV